MSTIYTPKKQIYAPNDPFFREGNISIRSYWLRKEANSPVEIDIIKQEETQLISHCTVEVYCDQCRLRFPNTATYERHYEAVHRNVCSVCFKIFPGSEWLQLHLDEIHNVFLKLQKEKGEKIHKCYVHTCKKSFSTPHMRRLHLVDKHHYPKYYPFDLVYTGTLSFEERKKRDLKNRERLKRIAQENESETSNITQDVDMDQLASHLSNLRLPKHISFGRRAPGLPQKKSKSQPKNQDIEMTEKKYVRPRKRGPKKKRGEIKTDI